MPTIKIGTKVQGPHGSGIIIGYNAASNSSNNYLMTNNKRSMGVLLDSVLPNSILVQGLISGFYDSKRYPYIVLFENNYKDVYGLDSLDIFDEVVDDAEITHRLHDYCSTVNPHL